ncbi:hypothetical protein [Sphingobacterium pedocola]|uniref:DUF4412 domain-containing protein n=1 Tax=Sphingobacterium pedocola TaxID=2082722 RepID=A0ABR9T7S4_9SPHI|nr:hypothetical protein [Sphingobacterium pedocola]MBE8721373.1 hypothetical protein [Sphingobacterium pedocola]
MLLNILLAITFSSFPNYVHAQALYEENKFIKFVREPNQSVTCLFSEYPTLHSLSIIYRKDIPSVSILHFKERDEYNYRKSLYFDLSYEADSVFFKEKYDMVNIVSEGTELFSSKDINALQQDNLYSIVAFKDSIIYRFLTDKRLLEGEKKGILGWPASYGGNMKELQQTISMRYKKEKQFTEERDSVYVLKCKVLRDDSLGDVERIVGRPSLLYDIIVEEFRKSSKSWRAAILETSGLRHDTFIRVLVRLNRDGSITIKTPRGLHTIEGY